MKNYTYKGTSNLVFTHEEHDYLVHGAGPHNLPEEAPIVKTHITRGSLVLVGDSAPEEKTKVKNTTV